MKAEMQARYHRILEEIAQTAHSAGRARDKIKLVVVTKGHPLAEIKTLYSLGARLIGENRPAEALEKQTHLEDLLDLSWHMIGHIQSRKAVSVAGKFDLVHSLDSIKLARRLDRFAGESGTIQDVLLQFNTSGEVTKSGFTAVNGVHGQEEIRAIEEILTCTHLRVRGLMTMAPFSQNPEDARPTFTGLRRLRDALAQQFPQVDWSQLSMGMSSDYTVAIEEGATLLRIGTAVMGRIRI